MNSKTRKLSSLEFTQLLDRMPPSPSSQREEEMTDPPGITGGASNHDEIGASLINLQSDLCAIKNALKIGAEQSPSKKRKKPNLGHVLDAFDTLIQILKLNGFVIPPEYVTEMN